MKKVFLLLSLVLSVYSIKAQQIKISQLPTMIGDPSGGYVPIVKGGLTQKIDARFLGYNRIDSVSISIGSGVDTFNYWKNGLIVFSNTYSPSGGGGGGGGALSTLSDVTITSLSNNQALVFNSGKWRNTILTTTIVNEGTNQYWTNGRFDTRFATKTTDSLTQGTTNKYYSNSLARTALSVSNPVLTYNNTTGVFGIQQATGTQSGYLTAIDWNNFNTKFNTPTGTASQYIRGDGVLATFPTLTTTLSALNDVNVAFVADGQLLKFNNSTGKWSNFTPNYLTGITSSTVISALGYTPFNANGLVTQYVRGNGTFATTDTSMIPNFSTKVRGLITAGSGINITNGIISNTITDLGQLINSPGYITGISGSQVINALGYTPANNATTLTINGVSFDLSQNRSWTIAGAFAALTDVNLTSTTDGQLIKYNSSSGKWINFTPNYLTSVDTGLITGFSSKVRSLFSAGSGLSYNSNTGVFTNTITNTNQLINGAGFITSINSGQIITALGYTPLNPSTTITINGIANDLTSSRVYNLSISGMSDVNITSPSNNQLLKYDIASSKWINFTPTYLTSINSSQITTALGYTPVNPNGTTSQYIRGDGSIVNFPTLTTTYSALTDVNLSSLSDGQLVKWNNSTSKWINFTPNYLTNINTSQVTTALGFTPVNPNGTNLQYIKGDGTFGSFMFNNLTDITVSSPSNNQLMRYNTGTSKWVNFTPNYFSPPDTLTYLATKTNIVKDTVIGFQIGDGGTFTPSNGTTTYSNPLLVAAQIVNVFKGDTVLPTFAVTGGGPYVSFDNTTGILTLHNTTFKTGQAVTVQYAFGSGVVPGGGGGGGGAVSSVFGRTGAIVAQLGDYSSFYYQIPTGTTGQYIRGDGSFATFPTLATVATTGNYTDLTNKPIIPTNNNQLTNGAGYLTGITGSQVITALGYTPFNPTGNTSQYVRGDGTLATSDTTMIPSFFAKVRSEFSAGSGISIANGIISNTITNTNQLTNGAGFLTSINSSQITTALGYTPANNATTITINGTVFDLSANRTYNLAVSNLTDVNITTITDGQLLKWNNSTSKWVNFTPNYLTSVDTTNISNFSVKVRSLFSAGSGISISGGVITNLITNTNQLTNGAGFITGNQTITLSSDITGSGTTAITATIGNNKVTYAKFQQVGALKMLGNTTGSTANVGEIGLGTGLNFSGGNLINTITNTNQLVNGAGFYAPTDTVNTLATKWFVTHNPDTLHVFGYGTGVRAISTSLAGDTLKFKTFVNSATTVWSYNSDSSLTVSCIMTPTQSLQATSTINWSLVGDQTTPPDNAVYGKIGGSKGWFPLAQFPITSGTTNGLFDWHEKNKIDSIITVINAGSTFDSTLYSAPTLDTLFAKRWNFVAGINMIISNTGSTQALNQYTISADTTSGTGKLATQGYVTRTEGQPITPTTLTDGATITWNTNNGRNASITLGGTGRTLTITNPVAGTRYTLKIVQDATGGRTITTWPSGTKWVGGTAPTLTSSANGIDIISLYYDGTNYFGSAQLAFN